jgi:hypothetical protein
VRGARALPVGHELAAFAPIYPADEEGNADDTLSKARGTAGDEGGIVYGRQSWAWAKAVRAWRVISRQPSRPGWENHLSRDGP